MRRSFAWAVGICVAGACGGKADLSQEDAGDASHDAKVKPDVSMIDTAPPPYMPVGKRCVANDAGAPLAWAPGDAGATLRPPIMNSSGGPVLANPVFVPMTFAGDDLQPQIEDFIASVGCTTYWESVASDYGVGDGISGTPVHLTETPPSAIDDTAIAAFIAGKIAANEVPAPVYGQTLYVIYYPDTTDITLQGEHSCHSFGGYHSELLAANMHVPYAVLPRCDSFNQLAGIDAVTAPTSHELLEAVTDPLPLTNATYQFPEANGLAWALAGGGEVGDLCEFNDDAFFMPSDYFFYVQHIWTSHSAFLAEDPCQPSSKTYIAAAPILPDTLTINIGGGNTIQANGIQIAQGNSKTINLQLIASSTWPSTIQVEAQDAEFYFGGQPALTFNLSAPSGSVGDTLQLTVNRVGSSTVYGLAPFMIKASSAGVNRTWWVAVGN